VRRSPLWIASAFLLPGSLLLYASSLAMDVATSVTTLSVFGVNQSTESAYRLLSTIRDLYRDGEWVLAIAITAFTIVFPVSKYMGLAYVLFGRTHGRRQRILGWIKNLGQWSMGDVFVVALLVVILRINTAATTLRVRVEPGLFVFAASVLSSMIVSVFLALEEDRLRNGKSVSQ
jgi:paraquat-inducible protein A